MTEVSPDRPQWVDETRHLRLEVPADEEGQRLDRMLGRLLGPHYSRSYLSALVEEGRITVEGRPAKPSLRVTPGLVVEGPLGEPATGLPRPEPMDIPVLHEDEALIMVDKPVGLIIHPGSGARSGTLINGLLDRYPELSVVGRAERPGIIHRLDRETSGVMAVARTNEAAKALVNQFKAKTVRKEYRALVWGEMPFDSDWIEVPLGAHPRRPQLRAVVEEGGQPASTFYEVRKRWGRVTEVAVFPRTGRTHQIRVHMEHLGFPIVGDASYGASARAAYRRWCGERAEAGLRAPVLARQALHAHRITFRHPLTDEPVTYTAPVPADMEDLLGVLAEEQGGA